MPSLTKSQYVCVLFTYLLNLSGGLRLGLEQASQLQTYLPNLRHDLYRHAALALGELRTSESPPPKETLYLNYLLLLMFCDILSRIVLPTMGEEHQWGRLRPGRPPSGCRIPGPSGTRKVHPAGKLMQLRPH